MFIPSLRSRIFFFLLSLLSFSLPTLSSADDLDNETCLSCHESDKPIVDRKIFGASVHQGLKCIDCHTSVAEIPHAEKMPKVECSSCHEAEKKQFEDSLHGKALARGDALAPRCQNCHGDHGILPVKNPDSRVAPLRILFVCGSCHQEGTKVQEQRSIHQDHILENYSESIHAEGLFKKGLSVSATCVSCHHAHDILPPADPRSSIAKSNIVNTCLKCHSEIENVHQKIINHELWEKEPHRIPVCVDCHQPHTVRKVFYDQGVANRDCLECHGREDIKSSADGGSLFVNPEVLKNSIHAKTACAQCHSEVSPSNARACATIKNKVNCGVCHNKEVEIFQESIHGKFYAKNDPNAPGCTDCHGTHSVLDKKNISSPTYPTNVPTLCASCHQEGEKAAVRRKNQEHEITVHY
jgi:predicted CXXCH cytochrome family protein